MLQNLSKVSAVASTSVLVAKSDRPDSGPDVVVDDPVVLRRPDPGASPASMCCWNSANASPVLVATPSAPATSFFK